MDVCWHRLERGRAASPVADFCAAGEVAERFRLAVAATGTGRLPAGDGADPTGGSPASTFRRPRRLTTVPPGYCKTAVTKFARRPFLLSRVTTVTRPRTIFELAQLP